MKKYIIALLAVGSICSSNTGFAQSKKGDLPPGCRMVCTPVHKHHVAKKTPKMTSETMVLNEDSPTTTVDIRKGIVYVNDKPIAVIKNPKYENHNIVINYNAPDPIVNVITDNSYTGNKPDMPMLGLYTNNDCNGGAMVEKILPNGPAHNAGLRRGDVITKLNGNDIENSEQLVVAIYKNAPGDNVSITYKHDGRTETTEARLIDAAKVSNCINPQMGAACGCNKGHMHEREGYSKW